MFCTSCGKQLQDTQNFCTGCGKQVQRNIPSVTPTQSERPQDIQQSVPFQQQVASDIKTRHGFTSFWLWLGIVGNVIVGFLSIYTNDYLIGVSSLVTAFIIYLIVKWKKWAFYALCVDIFISIFIYSSEFPIEGIIISSILQIVIIWAVLQLRNAQGVSAWKQLE